MFAFYGRNAVLGAEATGFSPFHDPSQGLQELRLEVNIDPAIEPELIQEVIRLAEEHGGWVAVGVWRWLYWDYEERYLTAAAPALDACVRAMHDDLGLADIGRHMERPEAERYRALYGAPPG